MPTRGGRRRCRRGVAAARSALHSPEWAGLTPAQRARVLWRIGGRGAIDLSTETKSVWVSLA
ncbi:hypothetical protein ACFYXF_03025 [Streptomyces sp. NPDC002680]|uniref:hypothetical protein n=1 Tax=Streptomyces sp. NPDC002680 TaxID=3364659 RepID=UPI0036ABC402